MRLGVVYQFFQTEDEPGHSLMYALCTNLVEQGNQVTVFCGETGYMRNYTPSSPIWKRLYQRTDLGALQIIRTYTFTNLHKGKFGRILNYLTFCLSSFLPLLVSKKPDLMLISSPPLFSAFSSSFICWLRKIPFIIEIRDLWPLSLRQMNILKNPLLIKIMSWMENFMYKHSEAIITLTEGIHDDLVNRKWDKNKIFFIPCGVDFNKLHIDSKAGQKLRKSFGWNEKTIVMYFGALGEANNIDVILNAAKLLRERHDILFVLVGDGIRKELLKLKTSEENLSNVLFLPPVSKKMSKAYLNAADLCVVTLLDISVFSGAIPTKLIDYMACGRPVLCGIHGEAKKIVERSNCGFTFNPNDEEALSHLVLKFTDAPEPYLQKGENGYHYARTFYTAKHAQEKFKEVLRKVIRKACSPNLS